MIFTEVVGRRLTPYLALETTTSLVSCELQGGGLSPLALTVKPFSFINKKADSFGRLPCLKFVCSTVCYIVEPLNKEAVDSLLSYPNVRSAPAGRIIVCTGCACHFLSIDMSEQIVDKIVIEITKFLVTFEAVCPIEVTLYSQQIRLSTFLCLSFYLSLLKP